jgi:hypothetical protein
MKKLLITVVVIAVVGGAAVVALRQFTNKLDDLLPDPEECTATVSGHTTDSLAPEQAQNAALITAVAVRRGLPARAATIALATAMQESKLYNLTAGDRDSVGLFQQRPSQGWGTVKEILDPVHATNAFYDALTRIHGYRSMVITEAAQAVQHSGFPEAYAEHEPDARALASALTGYSAHALSCRIDDPAVGSGKPKVIRDEVQNLFGALVAPPVVRGRSVTIGVGAGQRVRGWAVAQYLVAQADRLGIHRVAYNGWTWRTGDNSDWSSGGGAGPRAIRVDLG